MRALAAKAIDRLDHLRRLVPVRYLPTLVERKVTRLWENEDYRRAQESEMRFLLEHTDRASEIPELARRLAAHSLYRTYIRWHPQQLVHQEVRGLEWLTTRRDPDRSVVVSFMHHNHYEGMFASIKNAGVGVTVLITPKVLGADTPTGLKQHIRMLHRGNPFIPASGGLAAIQAQLKPGMAMAIASDVPGHTEMSFLGRRVLAPIGPALIATFTDSPVVIATSCRDEGGSYIQLHEPLEPKDFSEPKELLTEILRVHGEAVLAWPEVLEVPRARWGIIEE